jgi:hypothetical protein
MHEWSFREYGHAKSPRQRANPGSGRSGCEQAAEKARFPGLLRYFGEKRKNR